MKQLIITADDFGRSLEINAAIEHAHRAGFVTQASLMVNEAAVDDAVAIARRNPRLGIGLHLTLCGGQAARQSSLTDSAARFEPSPARAGLRYFLQSSLARPLQDEIRAQFERFLGLGFAPVSWDGHTHLHLHPTVLRITLPVAAEYGFRATRLVREPGSLAMLPFIFERLSAAARPALTAHGIAATDHVFGLRDTGRMSTAIMARLLRDLPAGISELYFHPGAEPEDINYEALLPLLRERQIALTTYTSANVSGTGGNDDSGSRAATGGT